MKRDATSSESETTFVRSRGVASLALLALAEIAIPAACGQGVDRPAPLLKAANYRKQMQTGVVEWSWWKPSLPLEGSPRGFFQRKSTEFTASETMVTDRGDEDGITTRMENGLPAKDPESAVRPRRYLRTKEGAYWIYQEGELRAALCAEPGGATADPRCWGLQPSLAPLGDVDDVLWRDGAAEAPPPQYEERKDGSLDVVIARGDSGTTTWWIDPARGSSPVRVTYEDTQGQVLSESRVTLRKFGEYWFPETVAMYRRGYKDGREPAETIHVESVAFNAPDQAVSLTPNDMGLQPGVMVSYRPDMRNSGHSELLRFDGKKAVPEKEFWKRVRAGELDLGPGVYRELDRLHNLAAVQRGESPIHSEHSKKETPMFPTRRMSRWERYVREFMNRNNLDDGQCERALTILRDCQQQAGKVISQHRSEFQDFERKAHLETTSSGEERAAKKRALDNEEARLLQPIDDVFEKQLKPRLDKLLTRAQRQATEAAGATTKPAAGAAKADSP